MTLMAARNAPRNLMVVVALATVILNSPAAADDKKALTSLWQGIAAAQESNQPILAIVGGEACPFCRALEREMETDIARKELKRWTVVTIDADRTPGDAEVLAIRAIPALRVLTVTGKLIAAREGAMSSSDLVDWLKSNFDDAVQTLRPELRSSGELTALEAVRIARDLGVRDATAREAAIRRLIGKPDIAAGPVAAAFVDGSLAARLAALELLYAWKAPVAGLDPWQPETLTQQRLEAISAWAISPSIDTTASSARELSSSLTQSARELIQRMLICEPAEAAAIRERMARHGRLLLPLVYERLSNVEADEMRQRLTALRYRLVATDELALGWPGGLDRLSTTDVRTRHQAMHEFSKKATSADESLLLELFSDLEPMIRELALQALHRIGGSKANSALVKLLDDPDLNVQAAVLKQLAESPAHGAITRLRVYVEKQQDPDLLVHAVRVFRSTKGQAAVECLVQLLKHENWRVRAEAAEAIGEAASDYQGLPDEIKADAYVALVDLLQDDDLFVVSRAVQVLAKARLAIAVNPLAEVAARHPALAVEVVKALADSDAAQLKVAEHLRRFAKSDDPKVRAAAVHGLCEVNPDQLDTALEAGLLDSAAAVRIAAAQGLLTVLERNFHERRQRDLEPAAASAESTAVFDQPFSSADGVPRDESTAAKPPKWALKLQQPLEKLLGGETAAERFAGAIALVAISQSSAALTVVETTVAHDPSQAQTAARVLRWIPWAQRRKFFETLIGTARGADELTMIAHELAQRPHPDAAGALWRLLAQPEADGTLVSGLLHELAMLYLDDHIYDVQSVPKKQLAAAIADLRPRTRSGTHWQRLGALVLLVTIDPDAALEEATRLSDEANSDSQLAASAFQVLLYASEPDAARKEAVLALRSTNEERKRSALTYLALGRDALDKLDDGIELRDYRGVEFPAASKPVPDPPPGLRREVLAPLAQAGDARQRASVGYLLCLMGEPEGLPPLIDYWKGQARYDEHWTKLVYQSITALDDSSYVPALTEIYQHMAGQERFDERDVATFYWTIRLMTGADILPLRKRIRDEVGLEILQRNNPFGEASSLRF